MKIYYEKNSLVKNKGLNLIEKTFTDNFPKCAVTIRASDITSGFPSFNIYYKPESGFGTITKIYKRNRWNYCQINDKYIMEVDSSKYKLEYGIGGGIEVKHFLEFQLVFQQILKDLKTKILPSEASKFLDV